MSGDGDRHPRACVPPLLYLNIVFTIIEFIWTGFGAYFTIKDFIHCFDQEHERKVIVGEWFIDILQGVPKKISLKLIFEHLSLGWVFLGVIFHEKTFLFYKFFLVSKQNLEKMAPIW